MEVQTFRINAFLREYGRMNYHFLLFKRKANTYSLEVVKVPNYHI